MRVAATIAQRAIRARAVCNSFGANRAPGYYSDCKRPVVRGNFWDGAASEIAGSRPVIDL